MQIPFSATKAEMFEEPKYFVLRHHSGVMNNIKGICSFQFVVHKNCHISSQMFQQFFLKKMFTNVEHLMRIPVEYEIIIYLVKSKQTTVKGILWMMILSWKRVENR